MKAVRNIGILAHIDAGKTTLTERMLYYAGHSLARTIGSVDSGDTVMDWMPQERERGITINSAAITLEWEKHLINLIDTPGHVDFTFEVERSLRVLDGAVVVLDAVAGVQSQTETVWRQANGFNIPRFGFINKMDRLGASLETVGHTLRNRLQVEPLFCHYPLGMGDGGDTAEERFQGVVDLTSLEQHYWNVNDVTGNDYKTSTVEEWKEVDSETYERALESRETLIESMCDYDDDFAELYLNKESTDDITSNEMWPSLKRITNQESNNDAIVLLCGAAQRNRAVQPLMSAIPRLLPSPPQGGEYGACRGPPAFDTKKKRKKAAESNGSGSYGGVPIIQREGRLDEPLSALAFKVQNDPQRGDVVFVRVYSGILNLKDRLLNTTLSSSTEKSTTERVNRLLRVSADQVEEIDSIEAGHIGAIVGLKTTRSGDTLCRVGESDPLVLEGMSVPPPVFTASIEGGKGAQEKKLLWEALDVLSREDPSLKVILEDVETKQTLVSGMGELHLQITLDRLQRQFKLPNATLGKMSVSFKESMKNGSIGGIGKAEEDRMVGTKRRFAKMSILVQSSSNHEMENEIDLSYVMPSQNEEDESSSGGGMLQSSQCDAIMESIEEALAFGGPVAGYPVAGVKVSIESGEFDDDSTSAAVASCASRAIRRALENAFESGSMQLMEPVMKLVVATPTAHVGSIVADISSSSRRGMITDVGGMEGDDDDDGQNEKKSLLAMTNITGEVPLREMVGYSTDLRSLTSGEANFTMSFIGYKEVLSQNVVNDIRVERQADLVASGNAPNETKKERGGGARSEEVGEKRKVEE
jgi:elongation factor G